jgi:hypothetical protein
MTRLEPFPWLARALHGLIAAGNVVAARFFLAAFLSVTGPFASATLWPAGGVAP